MSSIILTGIHIYQPGISCVKSKDDSIRKVKNAECDFDKSLVHDEYLNTPDQIAQELVNQKYAILISGHADLIGKYVYN